MKEYEILELNKKYNETDPAIIQDNLRELIKKSGYASYELSNLSGLSIYTIYAISRRTCFQNLGFMPCLMLCVALNASIDQVLGLSEVTHAAG